MLTIRAGVWALVMAGCAPGDSPSGGAGLVGRPFDVSQSRVQSAGGDRWESAFGRGTLSPTRRGSTGDWNYRVGGTVTSGVALYDNAFTGGALTASCSDRL